MAAIMPELAGLYGTLYLDSWTPETTDIIYKETNKLPGQCKKLIKN